MIIEERKKERKKEREISKTNFYEGNNIIA